MKWTPIGQMNRLIDVQQLADTPAADNATGMTRAFTTLTQGVKIAAKVRTVRGVNKQSSLNLRDGTTHVFETHFVATLATVTVDSRLHVDLEGRKFLVQEIEDIAEMHRRLRFYCEEVGAAPTGVTP